MLKWMVVHIACAGMHYRPFFYNPGKSQAKDKEMKHA